VLDILCTNFFGYIVIAPDILMIYIDNQDWYTNTGNIYCRKGYMDTTKNSLNTEAWTKTAPEKSQTPGVPWYFYRVWHQLDLTPT